MLSQVQGSSFSNLYRTGPRLTMPTRKKLLLLVALLGCLTTALWVRSAHSRHQHAQADPEEDDSLMRQPDSNENDNNGNDHGRFSSQQPQSQRRPLVPLDTNWLARNFKKLKRTVRQVCGGSNPAGIDKLMRHSAPVISTEYWRLHSLKGRLMSIESVQRTILSPSESDSLPIRRVPNVAHYILPFDDPELKFHHLVSILSCVHVMRPRLLILWYAAGRMTGGKWWSDLRANLTATNWEHRVVMASRPLPGRVYSMPVSQREHQSDVMRIEALLIFGGVYLDLDAIVLKPLDRLRQRYEFTIGREHSQGLCNAVFMAAPNSTFLAMWHTAYQVFNESAWNEHSVRLPHHLQEQFPQLCHVEQESMARPNWTPGEIDLIYGIGRQKGWDWRSKNMVLHLWFRWFNSQYNRQSIRRLDSMYGEVCRYILYGTVATT